jgi:hypothetical protein
VLSAAGFFPNAGAIPDVLNAGISALRGRPEEARESLTAAIPYAGDARKLLKGGNKLLDEAANEDTSIKRKTFPAGSPEHKQQRWEEYLEDKRAKGETPKSYAEWSNIYEPNMDKARKSREATQDYRERLIQNDENWPDYEVTVNVDSQGTERRLDIADVAQQRAIEHKKYEGGTVYNRDEIVWEHERDALLVQQGWDIEWVFDGCEPSAPLRKALEDANIRIRVLK